MSAPWCDEIFTYYQIHDCDYSSFWDKTKSGLNRMPPLYFAICKLFFGKLENPIFASRLFSIFSSFGSIYLIFSLFKFKLNPNLSAILAIATTLPSDFFLYFSYEARPYAAANFAFVLFLHQILTFEEKPFFKKRLLFLAASCLLAPCFHYIFALSVTVTGLFHIFCTKHDKLKVTLAYFTTGFLYAIFHFPLLLEQNKFGVELAFFEYPSVSVAKDFLAQVIAAESSIILIMCTLWLCTKSQVKQNLTHSPTSSVYLHLLIAISLVPLIGFVFARNLEHFWFHPRFYGFSYLVLGFLFMPIFHYFGKTTNAVSKIPLIICISCSVICLIANYKQHRESFENPQKYLRTFTPDPDLQNTNLPIITDDLVLFFNYQYYGAQNIHFTSSDKQLVSRLKRFFPHNIVIKGDIINIYNNFLYIGVKGLGKPDFLKNDYHLDIPKQHFTIDHNHIILESTSKS